MLKTGVNVKILPSATARWKPIVGEVIEDDEIAITLRGGERYDQVIPWRQIDRIEIRKDAA